MLSFGISKETKVEKTDAQLNVRIPKKLISEIKEQSAKHKRSMSGQVASIFEEWLKDQKESAKA